MPLEISTLLLGALIGFLASLLTTIVTHWLQSVRDEKDRKWKSEQEITSRWWERKATAYGNIINALVDIVTSLGNWADLEMQNAPEEIFRPYIKIFRESLNRIEKAEMEGAYLISENAALALNKVVKELYFEEEDNEVYSTEFWKTLIGHHDVAKNCLQIVRDEAHKDLKILNL